MANKSLSCARLFAGCAACFAFAVAADSAAPRALPPGQLPRDVRLEPLKDLDGYFPFATPTNRAAWDARAERVRRQLLVTLGLWPAPTRTPLNAVVHGRIECDDYTVERVYFESLPGFYVTGSLYRPKSPGQAKRPAVLCPHGHWANGRFLDTGADDARREIAAGAERFEEAGRSPLQARCVGLARMGCVVFHYDMIGYADSVQITQALAHGFAKQRPEMNKSDNWGLFSPQAEAHLQSVMGLQTWNSIRALDFLTGLPDVDAGRIAVTGASGGGTQTFILCAIDPRPAVAFPAVMVSTAMQGGCTCENACGLRVGTGNVEFAALFAPKPQGMTAADDWTKEMGTKGFPELRRHYALLGMPDNVLLKEALHFGHNYNSVSRMAMYGWVNRHLRLGQKEPIIERDFKRLSTAELTVWNDQHPKPEGGPEFERNLLRWLTEDAARQLAETAGSRDQFERVYGGGIDVVIGRGLKDVGEVVWESSAQADLGACHQTTGQLRNLTHGEELPAIRLEPRQHKAGVVIWVSGSGKGGLYTSAGEVRSELRLLLEQGWTVLGLDLLFQGEFLADGRPATQTRRVKNPREAAAYTFGYNHSLFAQRVHDVLTAIAYAKGQWGGTGRLVLAGLEGGGPWVAGACAQARGALDAVALDTEGLRFGKVLDLHSPDFLPGGALYGDLPGMIALGKPRRLWLAGEGDRPPVLAKAAYDADGEAQAITLYSGAAAETSAEFSRWLLTIAWP
ncbi:MAG TPA: acetylxylan esterase [Verrucomicrobiota bacterium]|nr:acetylxylan esterase [Verrucomicrobiota bacterium]HRZ58357.1 acetylxylan esterase [Candidatus Paceibacterota bacterium]